MQIQLSGKVAEIIKAQVASGSYADAAAFISDIILKYETYYQKKLAELDQKINNGLEQVDGRECIEVDFDEVIQQVDKELGGITDQPQKSMDELDYIENLGVPRPYCFVAPNEWTGNNKFLPPEERKNAQRPSGCYAFCAALVEFRNFIDDDDWALQEISFLYIGKAVRLRSRMNEHEGTGMFNKCFDWCKDRNQTLESNRAYLLMVAFWLTENRTQLEAELIKKLKPVFNVRQE